jgi:hypothetical protein
LLTGVINRQKRAPISEYLNCTVAITDSQKHRVFAPCGYTPFRKRVFFQRRLILITRAKFRVRITHKECLTSDNSDRFRIRGKRHRPSSFISTVSLTLRIFFSLSCGDELRLVIAHDVLHSSNNEPLGGCAKALMIEDNLPSIMPIKAKPCEVIGRGRGRFELDA